MRSSFSCEDIANTVKRGKKNAQETMEALGMAAEPKENEYWDNPPIPTFKEDDMDEEQNEDEGLDQVTENPPHNVEPYTSADKEDLASSIQQLVEAGIIGEDLKHTSRIF